MSDHDPLDDIPTLSQPLLTDEGFVNEACLNELEATLKGIPETHLRPDLHADPEWSTKRWTTIGDVLGCFAYAVVYCFGGVPPKFDEVVGMLRACTEREMQIMAGVTMGEMSLIDVARIIHDSLFDLPQFTDWNKKDVIGENWLGLTAVVRNTCCAVRRERREFDRFNAEFEAKWARRKP